MHRQEYQINIRTDPNIATFIKHMCKMHVAIPRLSLGVVMVNTTTAINEEWLTAIESLPIHKILHEYIYEILTMSCNFCVYLKKTQLETDAYISLADIDYYIIRDDEIIKVKRIEQLVETLLHSFSEFRPSNTKTIELVAFSSGTTINDQLIDRLTFLDAELFNKEYRNIKIVHSTQLDTYLPFSVIAPEGNLRLFMERYSWFDLKDYTKKIFTFLKEVIINYISKFELDKISITKDTTPSSSSYDEKKKIIFTNDVITMCVINFFGCNCQLGTFHVFDISKINMKLFRKEVEKTISEIYGSVN